MPRAWLLPRWPLAPGPCVQLVSGGSRNAGSADTSTVTRLFLSAFEGAVVLTTTSPAARGPTGHCGV